MHSNSTPAEPEALGATKGQFLYQPAPWVLYAVLISIYLVLRFILAQEWPTRFELQLDLFSAAVGTAILAVSGATAYMAKRAASSERLRAARHWLLLTLLLGIGFAIFQVREFRHRWQDNLIPAPISNSLHDRADLYYLSAVNQRLIQLATEINTDKVHQNRLIQQLQNLPDELRSRRSRLEAELENLQTEEPQRIERLAIINRLLVSEAKWTSSVVATSDDIKTQRMAIASLAYDVHPHRAFAASRQQFRQLESQQLTEQQIAAKKNLLAAESSVNENSEPIKALLKSVAEVKAEQRELEAQLKSHQRELLIDEELADAESKEGNPKRVALEQQLAEVNERLNERNAKLTKAANLVTQAEDSVSRLSQELKSNVDRQTMIAELDGYEAGLNQQYDWLRLPVCIPSGKTWAWTYFALMIAHASHLVYAALAGWVLVIASMLVPSRLLKTTQVARNWHSMVVVWIIIFVLVYLI